MKAKLTITIDEDLIPRAKQIARRRGTSLSRLIETNLRQVSSGPASTFSQRWRGAFVPANRDDDRYRYLAKKFL